MSVGHPICCRKATAQILFFGYAPYPFQNFDSGLENTPPPPCLFRQKESAGHSRRRKKHIQAYMESSLSHRLHHSTLASWMGRCIHSTITPAFGVVLRNMVRGGSAYSVLRFWVRPGLVKWGVVFRFDTFLAFLGVCRLHYAL